MIELNPQNFGKEVLKSKQPVAVEFYVSYSGPCIELAPIIKVVEKKYAGKMNFARLDSEKYAEIAAKYINVDTEIPSIIFFKDGEEVDRVLGSYSEYALNAKIDNILVMKK
ncbi:thioredoxin family protein [Candidatus Woesearchaeota archaeon]|nr:thioredoxin family protein [Candidatus Woesearchaeota archaeon]